MSKKPESTAPKARKAILIGLITQHQNPEKAQEYLDELSFLVETDGLIPVKQFVQRLDKPDKATFVGKGKLHEIKEFVKEHDIDVLVFDDELSPSQQRNLEKEVERKILDRTYLILEIFAARARTAHAATQVKLAQYQYLLPRLTGMWTHLERQRGGTGTRGGAGEKEIETDRRNIRDRISILKKELASIDKQMATQRKNRGEMIRVALVGYTNVGKSTLMNLLSKSTVFAENKLFATLDTTVRKVVIDNLPFLLSDTVGFIRKLPTQLVESFKSTLDEVREADILLHVVDISHPAFADQMNTVNTTLAEIGAGNKLMITIFNKIDAYRFTPKDDDLIPDAENKVPLEQLKKTWIAKEKKRCAFISATQKNNIDELRDTLYREIKKLHIKRYPYNHLLY
ncbi:MAG: GTPase HflX [Bacteroidetes bacterium]|nr:GTPase HflX [Bacteroidota bacterium]